MFEAAVDGFGGTIARVRMIEVARVSLDWRLSVLSSVMISVRELGTPASLGQSISARITALPRILLGSQ